MQVVALPYIPNQESVLLKTLRTNPTHDMTQTIYPVFINSIPVYVTF